MKIYPKLFVSKLQLLENIIIPYSCLFFFKYYILKTVLVAQWLVSFTLIRQLCLGFRVQSTGIANQKFSVSVSLKAGGLESALVCADTFVHNNISWVAG